jgi:pimeloyl-ACP methyl ester carboxylesterase
MAATLSYDRLGVGKSAHPNGIQTVQIYYEIAQSISIAQTLRSGSFPNIPAFSTVVGVGHSYGSNLLTGLASVSPDSFDQLVLTGFSNNVTMGPLGLAGFESTIANVAYPDRFPYGNDYLSTPSVSIDQKEFFHYPNYSQAALDLFTTTKGEYTIGQVNSIAGTIALDRSNYTKPTFVITGNDDAPYCERRPPHDNGKGRADNQARPTAL